MFQITCGLENKKDEIINHLEMYTKRLGYGAEEVTVN